MTPTPTVTVTVSVTLPVCRNWGHTNPLPTPVSPNILIDICVFQDPSFGGTRVYRPVSPPTPDLESVLPDPNTSSPTRTRTLLYDPPESSTVSVTVPVTSRSSSNRPTVREPDCSKKVKSQPGTLSVGEAVAGSSGLASLSDVLVGVRGECPH